MVLFLVERRRRLAARRPRRPGPGDRRADQHARRGGARPAEPRAAAGRVHQQRLPRARALARRRGRRPAGAVRPVADRLGVRRPHGRVRAGRRPAPCSCCRRPRRGCPARWPRCVPRCTCHRRNRRPFLVALPRPGGVLGGRRPLRLARPVAAGRRVRHRQPPGRRPADPRAQRHRRARLAGPARRPRPSGPSLVGALVFAVGRGRHRGRPVHRVGDGAVRRRGRHRLRLRGRLPRRRRHHHRRRRRPVIAPGLLAAIFVVGYLAFSLPAIAAGIAVGAIGLERTAEIYGIAVIVLALSAVASLLRSAAAGTPRRRPTADEDSRAARRRESAARVRGSP